MFHFSVATFILHYTRGERSAAKTNSQVESFEVSFYAKSTVPLCLLCASGSSVNPPTFPSFAHTFHKEGAKTHTSAKLARCDATKGTATSPT